MSNIRANQKATGRIVQNGEFCFEVTDHCADCDECGSCVACGYINQLSFESKFLIEDMDYLFSAEARIEYRPKEPFIEILCLDSIDAVNCERNHGAAIIQNGVHIHFHQAAQGELRFSPAAPIRGVRIVIKGRFFNDYLVRRFPQETLDFILLGGTKNKCLQNPRLQVIFSQIRHSVRSGVECEIYYESKIIELLYIFMELNNPAPDKRRLSSADMTAVEKTKAILEERFCNAPKIAQLAVMTGTSQAKLQNDFKAAFGCTIHEYLQSVRMAKALDKVEHTETPLYAIAKEVGCKNPGRFAEIFKEAYGITPDMFRRDLHG